MEFPQVAAHYFVESRPGVPETESDGAWRFVVVVWEESTTRASRQLTRAPVVTLRQAAVTADSGTACPPADNTADSCITGRATLAVVPLTESPFR